LHGSLILLSGFQTKKNLISLDLKGKRFKQVKNSKDACMLIFEMKKSNLIVKERYFELIFVSLK
jgi:hypothetical protein